MNEAIQLLKAADRTASAWKNGGGVTREVARSARPCHSNEHGIGSGNDGSHRDGDGFDWRVSIAEVAQAGAFSHFPGCRRLIAIIAGGGMGFSTLAHEPLLLKPRDVHAFDGTADVSATLPFGPVSDLNVIFRPAAVRAFLRFCNQPQQWGAAHRSTVILLNLATAPLTCAAGSQPIELARLDGVRTESGAGLSVIAGGDYAVIEIERL